MQNRIKKNEIKASLEVLWPPPQKKKGEKFSSLVNFFCFTVLRVPFTVPCSVTETTSLALKQKLSFQQCRFDLSTRLTNEESLPALAEGAS